MAEISFVRPDVQSETPAAEPAEATPVTPGYEVSRPEPKSFFDDQNIALSEIKIPRLNIVQGVGELAKYFTPGEIVLDGTHVIHVPENRDRKVEGDAPLNITCIGFRPRQFAEKLAGGKEGLVLDDERDVAKNNGTLNWREWQESLKPGAPTPLAYFQRVARGWFIVERPSTFEDIDDLIFPHLFVDGEVERHFALATWRLKASAYENGAKTFLSARKTGILRDGYLSVCYLLTSAGASNAGNDYFVPSLRPGRKNSPEFKNFVLDVLGCESE